MALEDQLGITNPQGVVNDLIAEREPSLAQNGPPAPQAVVDHLIREEYRRKRERAAPPGPAPKAPAPDFSHYGRSEDEAGPEVDFSQFGEADEPARPDEPAKPARGTDKGGLLDTAARIAAASGNPLGQAPALAATLFNKGAEARQQFNESKPTEWAKPPTPVEPDAFNKAANLVGKFPGPIGALGQAANAFHGSELEKSVVKGVKSDIPKSVGDFGAAVGHASGMEGVAKVGETLSGWADKNGEPYKPRVSDIRQIRKDTWPHMIEDFGAYFQQGVGQAVTSSAPGLATGLLAQVAFKSPRVAMAVGSSTTSYVQNVGDMYSSALEDKDIAKLVADGKVSKRTIGQVSLALGAPMAALDAYSVDHMLGRKFVQDAKDELMKRVAKGIATGAITEGATEGLQQIIQEWGLEKLGSKKGAYEQFMSVLNASLVGMFGGMVIGGTGSALQKETAALGAMPNAGAQPGAGTPPPGAPPGPQPQTATGTGPGMARPAGNPQTNDGYDPDYSWGTGNAFQGTWFRDDGAGGRWYFDPVSGEWNRPGQGTHYTGGEPGEAPPGSGPQAAPPGGEDTTRRPGEAREDWEQRAREAMDENIRAQEAKAEKTGPAAPENKPPPFETQMRPKVRSKLEGLAAGYGEHHADDIAAWNDEKLREYVNVKGGMASAPDEDIMRRAGHTDEEIAGMSPEQKRAATEEAKSYGIHAGEEPPRHGTREAPIDVKTAADLERAAATLNADHTHAQGEANNVQRGHVVWNGMGATLEAGKGGMRRGTAPDGTGFETKVGAHYGYWKDLPKAKDGGAPDVFFGDHPGAPHVFVLDELDPSTGEYRQSKSFAGFQTFEQALDAYLGTSSKDTSHVGGMAAFPVDEFKTFAKAGGLSRPVAQEVPAGTKTAETSEQAPGNQTRNVELNVNRTTLDHVEAVEAAMRAAGVMPPLVDHTDTIHAADLHAQGVPANEAFQAAVVRRLVAEGHISEKEARDAIGPEADDILDTGRAPRHGAPAQAAGAATGGPTAEAKPTAVGQGRGRNGEPAGQNAAHAEKPAGGEGGGRQRGAEAAGSAESGRRAADHAARRERHAAAQKQRTAATSPNASDAALIGSPVSKIAKHSVTAADGTSIEVVPVVVEAGSLIASSDAGYDAALQPRNRDRAASQAQVREIATRLQPERLGYSAEADRGAPIVGPDHMVESGNGRVAALRALYSVKNAPNAQKYRDWLAEQGVDVAGFKEPILVRQRRTDMTPEQRQAFTVAANQAATLAMSAPERAAADADHLTPDMLGLIRDGENLGSLENRGFVRAFIGALPASERGALSTESGGLSAEGLTRVRNAVLAKAYGDADVLARITESTDDDIKSISNALVMAAPTWAKLRADIEAGRISPDLDVTADLVEAVKRTADLRGRGQKLDDFLRQNDAFDTVPGPVEAFMRTFYNPSGRRAAGAPHIAEALRFYADEAAKVTNDPRFDLGEAEVTSDDIQRAALAKAQKGAGVQEPETGRGNGPNGREGGESGRRRETAVGGEGSAAGDERGARFASTQRGGGLFGEEPGAEGKPQSVIPGAERVSGADLAKRRAAEPLKPRVAQRALEGGLFGEESKQLDLVEEARKPPKPATNIPENIPPTPESLTHDAFPDQVAKAPPAPQIQPKAKPKAAPKQASLFDWETPNERRSPQVPSPKALDEVPAAEGGGAQGGGAGRTERGATHGGTQRTDGNRAPDESGVSGARGEGGAAAAIHPAAGGGRPGGRAGARTGGAGTRVSEEPAGRVPDVKPQEAPSVPAINYRITDETELGKGAESVKFRDNLAAIETLKKIETENRRPTPAEQRALARYVGWGGLANAFRQPDSKEFKADWADRGAALEALMTDDELRAARNSTRNAHYTSKTIIDAMWKAAQRLGFKGGLTLENSMGTGNFLGLVPEAIAGQTRFVGVELDSVTARIAKALYPQETVLHSGFQRVPLPDGEFVLSIGNPPFGSEALRFRHKPELHGISIHNQFFLASLDALQPGGLHMAVVSRYLLDAQDKSARERMAVKAELVGAIRLPDTAFKENARTEVVTDIVVMQRRSPDDEKAMQDLLDASKAPGKSKEDQAARKRARAAFDENAAWVDTAEVRDPLGGEPMKVNAYFDANPKMVMGRLERSGTMRTHEEVNVKLDKPERLAEMLDEAVNRLPKNKMDLGQDVVDRSLERFKTLSDSIEVALSGEEPGHIKHDDNGRLVQVTERETPSGEWEATRRVLTADSPWSRQLMMDARGQWYALEPQVNAKGEKIKTKAGRLVYERKHFPNNEVPQGMRVGQVRLDRLGELARLRDLLRRQIVVETQDAKPDVMERNRGQLAAAYRAYTEANGLLNEPRNMQMLNDMPDGPLLMSLESGYRPAVTHAKAARTGQKVAQAAAKPAAILSQRVIPKYEAPTKAATPADAIAISLSERGSLDLPRIATLLGIKEDQAAEAIGAGDKPLAFLDPETKVWEARNNYLSGHVRRKLAAARIAGLDKNVKELEAVQPARWAADQVTPLVASNWIPTKHYEDFVKHLLGVDKATVNYEPVSNAFNMLTEEYGDAKQADWGTPDMPADSIIRGMLNSRLPRVMEPSYDENGRETGKHENKEKSALVALKAREIENAFSDWVFKDADRRRELVDIYNDKFNTRVPRQHDGSHLVMPGKSPEINLHPHVKNGIWRGIYERFMLVDHVVGAGKTFLAIGRIMERRRMGLSRKPMVTVPNHLVEQWAAEAYRLYPGAKILAAGKNQFDVKNRRKLFARIATGDWDMVIVPHSSFEFIGISPDTELRFLEDQLRQAQEAVVAAREAAGDQGGFRKPFTVKEAERLVTIIEGKMDALRGSRRDNMLSFEQMGVDDLTVDEAHEFKNLFYSSRMTGVRGMGDKTGSQKAFDLYNKVKVLTESPTGSVTFLTGTPISNSAVEMYSMMRYLAAKELRELGIEHFDAWRSQYVSAEPAWEPTETGGLKEVTRLGRSWSNMRALMDLYHSFTDSVTQEDINRQYAARNNGAEFPIPKVATGDRQSHVVKPTPAQVQILNEVLAGFDGLEDISDPDERNAERLRLMDRARKVSLDARAADIGNPSKEEGGKLEAISDEVTRIYKKWNADKGTQLIFLDRSVHKAKGDDKIIKRYDELVAQRDEALASKDEAAFRRVTDALDKFDPNEIRELRAAQAGGWTAYKQIKENLIARGIPADEIRFIQEANSDGEKRAIFDAVNDGEIRVLIGSTQRMGAGTNVQERLVGLHHADVTWKPSDIEQREGRIIRQGNKLYFKYKGFEVEIHNYVTERTIDAKMWDLNSQKLRMINGIRKYDGAFNMEFADEDAVSMAEIAALASGDPLLMERVKLDGEIEKLEMQARGHGRKMAGIEDAIDRARRTIADYPARIVEVKAAADDMMKRYDALRAAVAARRVTVEGKTYTSGYDATQASVAEIERQKAGDENAKYSVNIDGNNFTAKDAIASAINSAMGDQAAFEAKIGGETYRRRYAASGAIAEKIGPALAKVTKDGPDQTVKIGRLLDADLEATVYYNTGETAGVVLALTQDGKTLAAARSPAIVARQADLLGNGRTIQTSLHKLEDDANNVATSSGTWMQDEVKKAEKALPELLPQLKQASPVAAKLAELREKQRALIETLDQRTRGETPEKARYIKQAMDNLKATSRTAMGVVDVSAGGAAKAEQMVEGLTGAEAAEKARANFEGVIGDLYDQRNSMPETGPAMEKLIDDMAVRINDGIVKPGAIMRTHETTNMQTPVADLAAAHEKFGEELAARLADPSADPIETAAYTEWQANIVDHFWSDGVGKTSRALAAVPLMRAGLPLPQYPPSVTFYSHSPSRGGNWTEFNSFYHELVESAQVSSLPRRAAVRSIVDSITDADFADALSRRDPSLPKFVGKEDLFNKLTADLNDIRSRLTTADIMNTPERVALQNKIADQLEAQGGYAKPGKGAVIRQERRADLVIGPSGAGKSSALVDPIAKENGSFLLDCDEAKQLFPEYDNGSGAGVMHEESSRVAEDILGERALERGDNIVAPLTGKTKAKVEGIVDRLTRVGYSVTVHYVDLPAKESVRRNILRYVETGRLVDPAYIFALGDLPKRTFDTIKAREDVDGYQEVSNDTPFGQPPRLVESFQRRPLRTSDQGLGRGQGGQPHEGSGPGNRQAREGPQARVIDPAEISTVAKLSAVLSRYGIDTSRYGHGEAKSLDGLVKEVASGESQLIDRGGQLTRSLRVLAMNVQVEVGGRTLQLYEDRQEFRDGRVRQRNLPTSLAEKLMPGESPQQSIGRALHEELGGITGFTVEGGITGKRTGGMSPSFPGLATEYNTFRANIKLDPAEYREEYREDQAEKSNIMRWRDAPAFASTQRGGPFTQTDTPEFKRWFGDSKVVDESGAPLVVYHSTDAEEFSTFERTNDFGFHFGTAAAANDRLESARPRADRSKLNEEAIERFSSFYSMLNKEQRNEVDSAVKGYEGERIIPVYLKIENPLRMSDIASWSPHNVLDAFEERGLLTYSEVEELRSNDAEVDIGFVDKILRKNGYDGIVYQNKIEGGGGDSYIVTRPEQIKSATGNAGTFDPNNPSMLRSTQASPGFQGWFEGSKVVDESGAPLRAYHGTTKDFEAFNTKQAPNKAWRHNWFGQLGSWFSAPSKFQGNYDEGNAEYVAGSFTEDAINSLDHQEGARVLPVYLSIKNPVEYDDHEELSDAVHEAGSPVKLRARLVAAGHDGLVVRNSDTDGHVDRDDWVAFEPTQIKSATGNTGAFDPNNPNMLAETNEYVARGMRGAAAPGANVLPPFRPMGRKTLGGQAQNYVLEHGKITGNEHLVAINQHGKVVAQFMGTPREIATDADFVKAMNDPKNSLVLHHNHPKGDILSTLDISQLARPGVASIWAHTHNGHVSRAALTPAAREVLNREANVSPKQQREGLYRLHDRLGNQFLAVVQQAIWAGQMTVTRGNDLIAHLANEVMARAGLIEYRVNGNFTIEIEKFNFEPAIERQADEIARSMFNGRRPRLDRTGAAGEVRHPGEMGATFETRGGAAPVRSARRADRAGGANDRAQAPRGPPQLNLPGFASPVEKPEKAIAAAVRVGGRLFTGIQHPDAWEAAERATGKAIPDEDRLDEGFITSTGRFVGRREAGNIAAEAEQIIDPITGRKDADQLPEPLHSDSIVWDNEDTEQNFKALHFALDPANNLHPKEFLKVDGKPVWAMAVDKTDNAVIATVRYDKAKRRDFHHSYYLPSQIANRVTDGEAVLVWGDERGIHSMEPMTPQMRAAVSQYYDGDRGNRFGAPANKFGKGQPPRPSQLIDAMRAEVVADRLEERNLPKLASISRSLGFGRVNTTELRVQLQDKFLRWQKVEAAAREVTGAPLSEDQQTYMAEALYYGRAGEQLERIDTDHIDPLIKDIKAQGLTLEDIDWYLMARHAPERNARLRQIQHPGLPGVRAGIADPSGMSDAEASRIIGQITSLGLLPKYQAIAKRIDTIVANTRQVLVQGGLISQATATKWAQTYRHYVPLRGWAENGADSAHGNGTGSGFDIRGAEAKQALGRKTRADSPLAYVLMQAQTAIVRAEKNKVGQTALTFVEAHPDPAMWTVDKADTRPVLNKTTGLVTSAVDPMWERKDNVFAVKRDGVVHYINFQGEYGADLARALKSLGTANMPSVLRVIGAFTRLQARLATSWNPDFMIPNFVRDVGEAFINMQEQDQRRFVKRFAHHLPRTMGGSFIALRGKQGGPYAQAFRDFDRAGGRIRFFGMEDADDVKKHVVSAMRKLEGGAVNKMIGAGEKALAAIEIVNGAVENATRLAVFMAARDVGLSEAKAAEIARNMTVNFNRKGELGTVVSALYMFANAAGQGITRMLAAMHSKRVRRMAYGLAAAGAGIALYNIFMGGDDDDGVPFYLKLSPWDRDANLILMWPKGMGHDGKYVKIPLPYGYSFFHVIGARSASLATGKDKAGKAVPAMIKSVLDAFDPLGRDENMLAHFLPSAVRPIVHLYSNTNWTGRPINPQAEPWNKHDPNASRYFRSSSEWGQGVAARLNRWTGGTKHEAGFIDVSPGTIDYLTGFVAGGLGRFVANTAATAWRGANDMEWQPEKTPIVRRFYGEKNFAGDRALYYQERDEVQTAKAHADAYRKTIADKNATAAEKAESTEGLKRLRVEHATELMAANKFKVADDQRKKIMQEVDRIRADTSLSAHDRDAKQKAQEQLELKAMAAARKFLKELRDKKAKYDEKRAAAP